MLIEKRTPVSVVFDIVNHLLLGLMAFICIYPLWYVFMASLSSPKYSNLGILILPKDFTLFNYQEVLKMEGLGLAALVSIARTVCGTVLSVGAVTLMGFIFTKNTVPFRKVLYRFCIVTMYVGGGLIPTFLVYRLLGLRNSFLVYIIPGIVSVYNMILVKTYIESSIPTSLEESAVLDGAGHLKVFVHIIFPLCMPIVATISLFTAVGQWNSWFDNMLYTYKVPELTTLQYMLYQKLNEASLVANAARTGNAALMKELEKSLTITPNAVRMTITMIVTLPIFLVYPFVQRYFMKGIMIGAVKG